MCAATQSTYSWPGEKGVLRMNVHTDMLTMYIIIYKLVHVHGNQPVYKNIQLLWTLW